MAVMGPMGVGAAAGLPPARRLSQFRADRPFLFLIRDFDSGRSVHGPGHAAGCLNHEGDHTEYGPLSEPRFRFP